MKEILDPLAFIPGVRLAALIATDGVPIAVVEGVAPRASASDDNEALRATDGGDYLAGLAASWLGDIARAVGPLAWDSPVRLVVKATRGSLLISQDSGRVLIVALEQGVSADDLRVPMDGAIGRMQRLLQGMKPGRSDGASTENPPGIFPADSDPEDQVPGQQTLSRDQISEVRGEN